MERQRYSHNNSTNTHVNEQQNQSPAILSEHFFPKSTLGDKKYIYGTFIEMAFHNYFLTMSHIYSKVFGADIMQVAEETYYIDPKNKRWLKADSEINRREWEGDFANQWYVWNIMFRAFRTAKVEEAEKLVELSEKHFQFLKPIREAEKGQLAEKQRGKLTVNPRDVKEMYSDVGKSYWNILEDLSILLREFRNLYSHYQYTPTDNQKNAISNRLGILFGSLRTVFLGAKREIKARFLFSDSDMCCAEQYKFVNDYNDRDERGRPKKKKVEIPGFRYAISKKDDAGLPCLTPFGILLFTGLFLEKKYEKIFSDKSGLVKKEDSKVICEMLSVYRMKLHIKKVSAFKDTYTLALDILNDMRKCPMALFDVLSPEDQKKFRVESSVDDDTETNEVLMVKYTDRFPSLALRYIDDACQFEDIRFQVSLGRYFYRFYNKNCIDGQEEPRVRSICKDVHGFGRITELEDARRDVWADKIRDYDEVHRNTADESPYITDHNANYLFSSNRIGMLIDKEGHRMHLPELTDDGVKNLPPTCWMSTYEIPAMLFLMMLKDGKTVEDIIKQTVENYQTLFADIRDGRMIPQKSQDDLERTLKENYGGISCNSIPRKMQQYLLCKEVNIEAEFNKWAESFISGLIDQSERRLKRLRDDIKSITNVSDNKFGKKRYVTIKPGKIADFLAKDIMLFQPCGTDNKGKLTSLNFRILQSTLAQYADGDYERLRRLFVSASLVNKRPGDTAGNPIVTMMYQLDRKPRNLIEFYDAYLQQRKLYLEKCKSEKNYRSLHFLYSDRTEWQVRSEEFYKSLAGRYLEDRNHGEENDNAIELPRGLFDNAIRGHLMEIKEMKEVANDQTKNMAYIIYAYFRNALHDDCQEFYQYDRSYKIFNSLYRGDARRNPLVYKSQSDIYSMLNRKSEQSLDRAIKKKVSQIFNLGKFRTLAESPQDEEAKLRNQLRDLKDNETEIKRYKVQDMLLFMLAKSILTEHSAGKDNKVRENAFAFMKLKDIMKGNVLDQRVRMSIEVESGRGFRKKVVQEDMKLKNFPQFYKFLTDRRLPSLMDIIYDNVISREMLEEELESYDSVRLGILKDVFSYEADFVSRSSEDIIGSIKSFSDMIRSEFDKDERWILNGIRNSFAHSSYAKNVEEARHIDLPQKASVIAQKFDEIINNNRENN